MATDVVTALGGDITISIAMAVATELLDGANEAQMPPVVLTATLLTVVSVADWLARALNAMAGHEKGLLSFASMVCALTQRVGMAVMVQILASLSRSAAVSRAVRVFTLGAVAVFFLFLQQTSKVGLIQARRAKAG